MAQTWSSDALRVTVVATGLEDVELVVTDEHGCEWPLTCVGPNVYILDCGKADDGANVV